MHRTKSEEQRRKFIIIFILASLLVMIIAACLTILFTRNNSQAPQAPVLRSPDSAEQVARNLHCTRFTDLGAAEVFSNDSGSCFIGSKKYAINTFPDQEARDSWLKSAAQLGVRPRWETSTSVVYPSAVLWKS